MVASAENFACSRLGNHHCRQRRPKRWILPVAQTEYMITSPIGKIKHARPRGARGYVSNDLARQRRDEAFNSGSRPHDWFRCSIRRRAKGWCTISASGTSSVSFQRKWDAPPVLPVIDLVLHIFKRFAADNGFQPLFVGPAKLFWGLHSICLADCDG